MPVEDRRRAQLPTTAVAIMGEEATDTLMDLVIPAGHDVATRADIRGILVVLDHMDERWSERLTAMDERWEQRSEAMEQRLTVTFERGLREAITSQTRALVVSLLVAVVAIAGVAFGLAG